MKILRLSVLLLAAFSPASFCQVDVGTGAPDEAIANLFLTNFFRNGFAYLVTLPPQGPVTAYGSTGYIQRFTSATAGGGTLALVEASKTDVPLSGPGVYQVYAAMYAYYNSVGPATAGYPVTDTMTCPAGPNACQYQLFNKPYALFAYLASTPNGQDFAIANPYYTAWSNAGGINTVGPPLSAATAVTSSVSSIAATVQQYTAGAIFNITSGTLAGRLVLVQEPAYDLYLSNGAWSGILGLPTADALTSTSGLQSQAFEGGTITWTSGGGATLQLAISSLTITPTLSSVDMNQGDKLTLQANAFDRNGDLLPTTISWSSSNSKVVSISASGATAVLTAVGGGSAVITASSQGKVSLPITVYVTAPCCNVGEGAPSTIIQQAFEDVMTRDNLQLQLPAAAPVQRQGAGYTQQFVSASNPSVQYLLAKPDSSGEAFYVTGVILAAYQAMGGVTGSLGYPASDPTPGGRQVFQNGTLAGNPVQLVSGAVENKWAALGYETGPAGSPTGAAAAFLTFAGSSGILQAFAGGNIYACNAGPEASKAFFVTGVIALAYDSAGGVAGSLGMPTDDQFAVSGNQHQDFEGGYIQYASGTTKAATVINPRRPAVNAAPSAATAGTTIRFTVSGFASGATLRISVTGLPSFTVTAANGSYVWETYVPASASSSTVTVSVVDTGSADSASTTYTVQGAAQASLTLAKVSGDSQNGAPGAQLTQPLVVALSDSAGNAIGGAAVQFAASPGAIITPASAVTDQNGQAQAVLRLPTSAGVALATATALGQVTTFSAIAVSAALASFPSFTQAVDGTIGNGTDTIAQKGALLASAAAILQYRQNRGELSAANGLATPATLNKYLTGACVFNVAGGAICDGFLPSPSGDQIVNLWRLAGFVSGAIDVSVVNPNLNTVRDLVAGGWPVLLALSMSANGTPAGAHYVVATGVGSDGGILIYDPNPSFGRSSLNDYLQGFAANSFIWKGTLAGAVNLLLQVPATTGFLLTAGNVSFQVTSSAGVCGLSLSVPATTTTGAGLPAQAPGVFQMYYCDGAQPFYQLDITQTGQSAVTLTDLGNPGSRVNLTNTAPASYQVTRPATQWSAVPQTANFNANAVVNAASFSSAIAPGGLISVFGTGLAGPGAATTADIRGVSLPILVATPFQLNAQVPSTLTPGTYPLRIQSPFGAAQQLVTLQATAPAIFQVGPSQAAIANQDGTLNTPTNPAARGKTIVVYGTGLGAVSASGQLSVAQATVTAVVQGIQVPVAFAGLTPGFIGLYQVNVTLPGSIPPGLDASFQLLQAGVQSNLVTVAIQ
jgi:uncharacterized protein (TIGR03437 family)